MKYILKKEYPGSPKLGYIDDLNKSGHNNQGEYVQSMYDKNPEFWEKVVEKDYEILSLARFCSIKPTITDVSDYGDEFIEAMLKCDNARIHSVKRLSDGEIFTIGDKVFREYSNYTINKISIVNDKCMVSALYDTNNPNGSCLYYNLNNLKKFKQKLFTTEDGVDIFENNTSIYILDKFTIRHIKHKDFNVISKHVKYFSTKEKAEEYILMNKPLLSYGEVQEYLKVKDCNKVLDLVQSKIQQSV